jgi:NADH-quinone oxidoreductase subunit L
VLLGVLTLFAGFVVIDQVGRLMGFPGGFGQFVFSGEGEVFKVNALVMVSSIALVLAGIAGGFYFWGGAAERARAVGEAAPQLYRLLRNKFYIDDLYQVAINRVVLVVAGAVAWYDRVVVNDTGVNGPADLTRYGGFLLKFHETGRMPNYALVMTLGIVVLAVVAFIVGT